MRKLFTLFLALTASIGTLMAEDNVQIDGLNYLLNEISQTASVVIGSTKRSGDLIIPASVTYNDVEYSVTSIDDGAFEQYRSLTSVTIANSVTVIGYRSFWGCTGLTSVTLGNNVTWIGSAAFQACNSLTSITIPSSVTYIGGGAFDGILNIVYSGTATGSPWGARFINGYVDGYLIYSDNTKVTLLACSSAAQGEIVIPNSVTKIGNNAFSGCSKLTSLIISDNVTTIGFNAIARCNSLKHISVGKQVKSFDLSVFENSNNITSIYWNAIDCNDFSYTECIFVECDYNVDIVFGEDVRRIPAYLCHFMTYLRTIIIPANVTDIGEYAFRNCQYLNNITIESVVPPSITNTSFSDNSIIFVPLGTLANYRNKTEWNSYRVHVLPLAVSTNNIGATNATFEIEDSSHSGKIVSCGMEDGEEFDGNIVEYIGLEPNSEYVNVPFFIRTTEGDYDTIHYSFTTTPLELTTKPSKPVSATTAILLAETNMSEAEVSCGFEYKRNDAPDDMAGTKVYCPVASGQMAGRLKNLKDDVYYKYRAFYQSAEGKMYYGDWQYIFTGDNAIEFDPILYTYSATVVKETEATISGYALAGSEDFTEQGFEYWAESRVNNTNNLPARMPAKLGERHTVEATGISMKVTLTGLDEGTNYKYRVYAKSGNKTVYGSEQSFTTLGEWQEGETTAIDNINPSTQSVGTTKFFLNGQLFIQRGNQLYNATGTRVN